MHITDEQQKEWQDKSTPPYTIVAVERKWGGGSAFIIYYRSFVRAVVNTVHAIDELGAFVEGQKLMPILRAKSERSLQRKNQGANK